MQTVQDRGLRVGIRPPGITWQEWAVPFALEAFKETQIFRAFANASDMAGQLQVSEIIPLPPSTQATCSPVLKPNSCGCGCTTRQRVAHVISLDSARFSATANMLHGVGFAVRKVTPISKNDPRCRAMWKAFWRSSDRSRHGDPLAVISLTITHVALWLSNLGNQDEWTSVSGSRSQALRMAVVVSSSSLGVASGPPPSSGRYVFEDDVVLRGTTPAGDVQCMLEEVERLSASSKASLIYLGTAAGTPGSVNLPRSGTNVSLCQGRTSLRPCATLKTHAFAFRPRLARHLWPLMRYVTRVPMSGGAYHDYRFAIDQVMRGYYYHATLDKKLTGSRPLLNVDDEWPRCIDAPTRGIFWQDVKTFKSSLDHVDHNW